MKLSTLTPQRGLFLLIPISLGFAFWAGLRSTISFLPEPERAPNSVPSLSRDGRPREVFWEGNAGERLLGFLDLLDSCRSRDDFRHAIEVIESRADKSEQNRYLAELFAAWLRQDPRAALAEVRRVESLRHDIIRVGESFRNWAVAHPDSAALLVSEALDGRQHDPSSPAPFLDGVDPPEFLLSIISGMGESSPLLAAKTLQPSLTRGVGTAGLEVLLQDWYPQDSRAAQDWAAALTERETRQVALAAVATKAGQDDEVAQALGWAQALPTPEDQQVALAALTSQWSQRRSGDAFAWTSALADETLRLSLMPNVLRNYALLKPGEAADWLNNYQPSLAIDASIVAYVQAIENVNPQAAILSAEAITNSELRAKTLARIPSPPALAPN